MTDKPAANNRTITLSDEEERELLARCLTAPAAGESGLVCGDLFDAAQALPRGAFALMIADPPYNLNKKYSSSRFVQMSDTAYCEFTQAWLDAVTPALSPNASLYVCCDWRSSMLIAPILEQRFVLRSRITWQREKGRGAKANFKNCMEDIWFCTVSEKYTFDLDAVRVRRRVLAPYRQDGAAKDWQDTRDGKFRDTCPSNFWDDITVPYWSMPENTEHPAQKPEKLMAKLILASSRVGDAVLDPFAGSGSALVTAKKLGRGFLGIEREARYCALAQKRLALAESDRSIQGYEDGVFWERNSAPR